MKLISILVSAYSDDNENLRTLKATADLMFEAGRTREAHAIYDDIRVPGVEYLRNLFPDMVVSFVPVIGMYLGVLEPSTMLTISFADDSEWLRRSTIVKRRLIDFGRTFSQKNVHLVDLYAKRPSRIDYGRLLPGTDVTFQAKLWIRLKRVQTAFENYLFLREIAREAKLNNLTFDASGSTLLLYSVSNENSESKSNFQDCCTNLKRILSERDMIYEINEREDVMLVNYGDNGYGETHTYSQAEEFLKK